MPTCLICVAVREEARFLRLSPPHKLLLTGMGARNARAALMRALADSTPELVISAGFAGGLNPAWPVGAVLFDSAHYPQGDAILTQAGARPGRFQHFDRILCLPEEKKVAYAQSGADAADMESAPICSISAERGIPCLIVRAISDAARDAMPMDFNKVLTADNRIHPIKMAWQIVRRPGSIPKLLVLRASAIEAAANLARACEALLR